MSAALESFWTFLRMLHLRLMASLGVICPPSVTSLPWSSFCWWARIYWFISIAFNVVLVAALWSSTCEQESLQMTADWRSIRCSRSSELRSSCGGSRVRPQVQRLEILGIFCMERWDPKKKLLDLSTEETGKGHSVSVVSVVTFWPASSPLQQRQIHDVNPSIWTHLACTSGRTVNEWIQSQLSGKSGLNSVKQRDKIVFNQHLDSFSHLRSINFYLFWALEASYPPPITHSSK